VQAEKTTMKQKIILILLISLIVQSCGMKTKDDLTENYDKYSIEILELKDYFKEIVPENHQVRIRYNSSTNVDLIVYAPTEDKKDTELLFRQWNLDFEEYVPEERSEYDKKYHGKTNSLELVMKTLNWTEETFSELYDKIDDVNCIGISNWTPTEIEYGYRGMGVFSYLVFDENLTPEMQEKYSNDCTELFYKDNIVLSYGSGATGSLCTPDFDRKK
jgi:hypothetical protein